MKLKEPKVKSIKTKISRTVHVEGDPLLDCAVYTKNKSCSKCARKERVDIFTKEIGWTPPVLETNPKKICNKKFNFPNQNNECIKALFNPLYIHNWEFGRKPSCTKNMYTSRFLHTSPSPGPSKMVLFLIFDKRLEVSGQNYTLGEQRRASIDILINYWWKYHF